MFFTYSIHGLIRESRLIYNLCEVGKTKGMIRSKNILVLKGLTIGNFMYDIYVPSLEKYIYHINYVHIFPRIFVEDFDLMLVIPNLEIFLQ